MLSCCAAPNVPSPPSYFFVFPNQTKKTLLSRFETGPWPCSLSAALEAGNHGNAREQAQAAPRRRRSAKGIPRTNTAERFAPMFLEQDLDSGIAAARSIVPVTPSIDQSDDQTCFALG